MDMEILENIAEDICRSGGILIKRGKSYLIADVSGNGVNGERLILLPLASPEALDIIQATFKEVTGETGDDASVLTVLDLLYKESHKHKIN